MAVFVSGSLAYDRIMDFPGYFVDHILPEKIHILNVCFTVNGLSEMFGGTAGNIAYSLSLLEERPIILAAVGKDFGPYRQWLESRGLPLEGIRVVDREFTAGAYITTDRADNQITGFNPGAMRHPSGYPLDAGRDGPSLTIVAPGNLEDMLLYSRACKTLGMPYICDPGQAITALSHEALLEMIDGALVLISNDYELELIRRRTGFDDADLLSRCTALITTLGEKGSSLLTREGRLSIAAVPPDAVVDPTGAGDAYRAGLIKGLVAKKPLHVAARIGAVCASYAVAQHGTQQHVFDLKAFNGRSRLVFGREADEMTIG